MFLEPSLLFKLVQFILKNRKGLAFKDWTEEDITVNLILRFSKQEASFSINNETKEINGVVLACANEPSKTLRVVNILTTEPGVMKTFIRRFQSIYPDFTIDYKHNEQERGYTQDKTNKLCKLILNIT